MKINFSEILISAGVSSALLDQKLEEIIRSSEAGDPVYLSDCLANVHNGGAHVIRALGEHYFDNERELPMESRITYKIKVLCDQWGKLPEAGDIVVKQKEKQPKTKSHKIMSIHKLKSMKMDGTYNKRMFTNAPFTVDKRGCITCDFDSAVHFLNLWGVHGVSGIQMTTKDQFSAEPADYTDENGKKNGKKHVWYHRYSEMTQEMYEALPLITKPVPETQPVQHQQENNSGKKNKNYR